MPKNYDPLGFFNIHFVAKHQKKCRGDPLGKNFFFRKSLAVPKKNERGESLVSPGMVCYPEKQEKPFWFSSLDQIVHFDAIIFCRTFVELFWSVRVDRKKSHYNSRVSLHEAPTKNESEENFVFEIVGMSQKLEQIPHSSAYQAFPMSLKRLKQQPALVGTA